MEKIELLQKIRVRWLALLLLCCLAVLAPAPAGAQQWAVYFSPHGGCTDAIVSAVDQARNSLHVQAYSFSSHRITRAIIAAQAREVKVAVILDKSNELEPHSDLRALVSARVPTWIDTVQGIAHNKIMIIDGETVITGSFNFTWGAEKYNAENLLVIHNKALAERYEANFQERLGHARPVLEPQ
jgi:phosphatidylserine/phosphatidylglycerophosphate/cardiolipin synthase-like enzyme